MRSIRRELTRRVITRVLPLIILGSVLSYVLVRAAVYREFDNALRHEMQVLSTAAERIGDGMDFDFAPELAPGGPIESGLDYCFDARLSDGSLLRQTPMLKGATLDMQGTRVGVMAVGPVVLPNGRVGRGCEYTFEPRKVEAAAHAGAVVRPLAPPGPVRIVIAASTSDLERPLAALALTELLVGTGVLCATVLALLSSVRRGLAPLSELAQEVTAIQPANLSARVTETGRPNELRPIASRLNALLARLEAAFTREKRFASNAAHELRTPVAEVRAIAEVGAGAQPEEMRRALREIASVASEMQGTISTLLTIARAGSGLLSVSASQVDLGTYLSELCTRRQAGPLAPRLECLVEPGLLIETDLAAIASVLGNLLDNALAYTPAHGRVKVCAAATPLGAEVCVRNHVTDLSEADLTNIFEPFWRKRGTPVAGSHSGLGLSLVRALCGVLNAQIRAELLPGPELALYLALPRSLTGAVAKLPAGAVSTESPQHQSAPRSESEQS